MAKATEKIAVYTEAGTKKTFASAVEWPGWSRSGKDEAAALQALADYGPRYAQVAKMAKIDFTVPDGPHDFTVVERLEGDPATDFGVPGVAPSADERAVDADDLARLQALLQASHQALDKAARAARNKELRKGPRGGGRELEGILRHVTEAEGGYLARLGWKVENVDGESLEAQSARARQAMLEGMAAAARGETPQQGPRGGRRWSPRYFARRSAWHVLDHAWEIEDRAE